MDPSRIKLIQEALNNASEQYRAAANEEMGRGSYAGGSIYNVYNFVKESMALDTKARNITRRYGVDPCNCA